MTALSKKAGKPNPPEKILVIRLGAMGDILRTLPAVRKVASAWPDSQVHWACDDRWVAVLEGHPDLDRLHPLPRQSLDRNRRSPAGWARSWLLVREYRRRLLEERFDLVLDFHGNLRSGLVGRFTAAPVRIGYGGHQQKEGNRWFTTVQVPAGDRRTSRMERNLSLLQPLGLVPDPLPDAGLPRVPQADARAREIVLETLGATERFAVISPGASRAQAYKKPPANLLAAAADRLRERGFGVLVTHGPGERPDAEQVAAASSAAVVAPPTTLPELVHLIRNATLFVGGDTGPLHVACATGTPVLGIYGPTDPRVNAPWNVPSETVFPPGRQYTGIKRIDREAGGFKGLESGLVVERLDRLLQSIRG